MCHCLGEGRGVSCNSIWSKGRLGSGGVVHKPALSYRELLLHLRNLPGSAGLDDTVAIFCEFIKIFVVNIWNCVTMGER